MNGIFLYICIFYIFGEYLFEKEKKKNYMFTYFYWKKGRKIMFKGQDTLELKIIPKDILDELKRN